MVRAHQQARQVRDNEAHKADDAGHRHHPGSDEGGGQQQDEAHPVHRQAQLLGRGVP